jgi:hypothetical protein
MLDHVVVVCKTIIVVVLLLAFCTEIFNVGRRK